MDELDALKSKNKELYYQTDKLRDELSKLEIDLEQKRKIIIEQNAQIKFLEDQIEAYQYCMNCRR